ncbi:MAG TPA: hypothetical protein VFS15_11950 [Kofleriaceae bacterium]|nr:hypothetical protein [Kofleriaceae bacterium]
MDRRSELLRWIEETQKLQRKLAIVFPILGVIAIGLMFWRGAVGGFALVVVALVAICSFWVTAAHNAAHRQKLAELDHVDRNGGKPLQTAHRRWHQ